MHWSRLDFSRGKKKIYIYRQRERDINIQSAIFLLGLTSAFKGGTADGEGLESRAEEEGAEDSEGWSRG